MSPYDRLKQDIVTGALTPGTQLGETDLAERFGVSRTPVREALQRLEADGLVARGRRGLQVASPTPGEILDTYALRVLLEGEAAEIATQRATYADQLSISRLAEAAGDMDSQDDPLELMEYNRSFHRAVWAATHNEPLKALLDRLDLLVLQYPTTTLTYPGRWDTAGKQHLALSGAISNRDGPLARQIATAHFVAARDIRIELLRNSDELAD